MRVNKQIREYIESNGLKFSFVAEQSRIEIKRFSRMMNSKQPINTDDYEMICREGLKIDPTYFYGKKFLETQNNAS